ncbi:paramyosin [Penicillium lagena]|uniref:paramyosin n=1 Tax=Penicillium lagena TaxID=94218 RepID=UPI002541E577|nr:paramyosin [Penicillium lagena]KAJ5623954.1 paramyosin [Penicillium lagena]
MTETTKAASNSSPVSTSLSLSAPQHSNPRDPRLAVRRSWSVVDTTPDSNATHRAVTDSIDLAAFPPHPAPNNASAPSPQPRPVERSTASGDAFIRSTSDMVQVAIRLNQIQTERDNVTKELAYTERHLHLALSSSSFPTTIKYYQQNKEMHLSELARIDRELNEQKSLYRQLEENLLTKWTLANAPSESDARLAKLEAEIEQLKAAPTRQLSPSGTKTVTRDEFQEWVDRFERSLDEQNSRLMRTKAKLLDVPKVEGKIAALEGQVKRVESMINEVQSRQEPTGTESTHANSEVDSAILDVTEDKMSEFARQLEALKSSPPGALPSSWAPEFLTRQFYPLRSRIGEVEEKINSQAIQLSKVTRDSQEHDMKRLDDLVSRKLDEQVSRLESVHGQINAEALKHRQRLDRLENKPAINPADFGGIDQKVQGLSTAINRFSGDLRTLQEAHYMPLFRYVQEQVVPQMKKIPDLEQIVSESKDTLETLSSSIRSLELRYNNLTTENVVKNMIHAMEELYPSMGEVRRQVEALRESFVGEIPALMEVKKKVDQLQPEAFSTRLESLEQLPAQLIQLSNQVAEVTQDKLKEHTRALQEINQLQNQHEALLGALAELDEKTTRTAGDLHDQTNSIGPAFETLRTDVEATRKQVEALEKSRSEIIGLLEKVDDLQKSTSDFGNDTRMFPAS